MNSINRDYLCDGNSFNIQYFTAETFNTGNIFTAQLSDAAGSFTNPVDIGSVTSTTFGSITATILILLRLEQAIEFVSFLPRPLELEMTT